MSNYPDDFRGLPNEIWTQPIKTSSIDCAQRDARMAEIIAEHEARGCTCHSCTKRKALGSDMKMENPNG